MKHFIFGAMSAYGFALFALLCCARLGVLPVRADVPPSRLEARLFGAALHAAVSQDATHRENPVPPSNENLLAGAKLYRQMCSRCHGLLDDTETVLGRSFYPPAPSLSTSRTRYTDSETFWIVKHGIRNTGMPAWGNLLSDDDIWHVVALLRNFD
jgi:mono/diheme cytochrome c family protein